MAGQPSNTTIDPSFNFPFLTLSAPFLPSAATLCHHSKHHFCVIVPSLLDSCRHIRSRLRRVGWGSIFCPSSQSAAFDSVFAVFFPLPPPLLPNPIITFHSCLLPAPSSSISYVSCICSVADDLCPSQPLFPFVLASPLCLIQPQLLYLLPSPQLSDAFCMETHDGTKFYDRNSLMWWIKLPRMSTKACFNIAETYQWGKK